MVTSLPKIASGITSEWARFDQLSAAALYQLLRFRQQIFVVDQRSPYPDLDGLDVTAWHCRLWAGGDLAGCLRLLPPDQPGIAVRIGRVAVAVKLRRQGLGRRLMTEALSFCRVHHPGSRILLGAQLYLSRFYQEFGFLPASEPYDDYGVPHIDMALGAIASRSKL
jgi:ElaA protein